MAVLHAFGALMENELLPTNGTLFWQLRYLLITGIHWEFIKLLFVNSFKYFKFKTISNTERYMNVSQTLKAQGLSKDNAIQ